MILDPDVRAHTIHADATRQTRAAGLDLVEDRALLAEVAGLVEWPVVLMGHIDPAFLDLPPEVLQTAMKTHQKFFSVRDPAGRIVRFVTVANIETADDGATILAGNQKVLSARLADAKFFWENDVRQARTGMGAWADALHKVTFHNRLGTQGARVGRIVALARTLAPDVGADAARAGQAAQVAKLDLSSQMVQEFPELQGIMGRYYSAEAGYCAQVAAACRDHHAPLGPLDAVPRAPVSVAVALADKLDLLAGFWAIGEMPTGSKDPFALRRAALGVIRLILENRIRVRLLRVFADANPETPRAALLAFFHDRFKVFLRERGVAHDVIDACLAMPDHDDLVLLDRRARALQDGLNTPAGEDLLKGYKRASNILSQAEANDGVEYSLGADPKFADTPQERALFDALDTARGAIGAALDGEDFAAAMTALSMLRSPVDAFFDAVQVNTPNAVVRRNRLNLLAAIRATCHQMADLSRLAR